MPAPARRRPRALVLALAGGLALAGLVTAAGPAVAAPLAEGGLLTSVDFVNAGGAGSCSATTNDKVAGADFSSETAARTATSASTTNITDGNDVADVTTLTGRSSASGRVTAAAGSLSNLDMSTSLRGTLRSAYGGASSCVGSIQLVGAATAKFQVARAGWLSLTASKSAGGSATLLLSGTDQEDFQSALMGVKGTDGYRFFIPRAGEYEVTLMVTNLVETSTRSNVTDATVTASLRGDFRPAGAAMAAPSGPGTRFLTLGERSCASNSVAATFTANARKIKSAQVFVNGRRVAKVRSPKPGRAVPLRNLNDLQAVSVRAVIVPKKGKAVTVTRSYLACS